MRVLVRSGRGGGAGASCGGRCRSDEVHVGGARCDRRDRLFRQPFRLYRRGRLRNLGARFTGRCARRGDDGGAGERKSVGKGKRVNVRVDLGDRRVVTKKKTNEYIKE